MANIGAIKKKEINVIKKNMKSFLEIYIQYDNFKGLVHI